MISMARSRVALAKASPLMDLLYRPACLARPAGGAGLVLAAGLLEEHAQRGRAVAERGGDARGEAIAGGGADHQHALRTLAVVVDGGPGGGDLFGHVELASDRMGRDTDEAAHFGFDDHE